MYILYTNNMKPYSLWIPVRNEEKTIGPLILSALDQENPPENIYVCVNGSTDRTWEIVHDISQKCEQVIPLTSSPWKANAWNAIVQQANTYGTFEDVMVFCDGDIKLGGPETLSTLVHRTRESAQKMVGGSIIQLPSNREKPYKLRSPSWQLYTIKKELLTLLWRFPEWKMPDTIINEDLFLTLIALPHVHVIDEVFFYAAKPSRVDLIITQLRILRWIRQLMDMGMRTEIDHLIEMMLRTPERWHTFRNFKYKYIIPWLAKFVQVSPNDRLWTIAESTKKLV